MRKLFLLVVSVFAVGCGVSNVAAVDDAEGVDVIDESELSTRSYTYLTVRRDYRKCMAPYCGGYWVKDVNVSASTPEVYVSGLTYVNGSISPAGREQLTSAGDGELVIRGRLGALDSKTRTRKLVVKDAYRGLPGAWSAPDATVYAVERLVTACLPSQPCPMLEGKALNVTGPAKFAQRLELQDALVPMASEAWLREQVLGGEALVMGQFLTAQKLPAPPTTTLSVSNVFFKLEAGWSCPVFRLAQCPEGQAWTFQYSSIGCIVPAGCTEAGACIALAPPECAPGYRAVNFAAKPFACSAQVCEPEFLSVVR